MWPCLLTAAVSAAMTRPYLPPLTTALSFEVGSDRTALPEVKATYLYNRH